MIFLIILSLFSASFYFKLLENWFYIQQTLYIKPKIINYFPKLSDTFFFINILLHILLLLFVGYWNVDIMNLFIFCGKFFS